MRLSRERRDFDNCSLSAFLDSLDCGIECVYELDLV